jgi:hypothetical protein
MTKPVYWVEYTHYNRDVECLYVRAGSKLVAKEAVEEIDRFPTDHVMWTEEVKNRDFEEVTDYGVISRPRTDAPPKRFPIINMGDLP